MYENTTKLSFRQISHYKSQKNVDKNNANAFTFALFIKSYLNSPKRLIYYSFIIFGLEPTNA